jgi:sec-independent protein translocase protein TatA
MPVGPTELIVVLVIVLFVFGAGKLPEVGRALGQSMKEFRQATQDESSLTASQKTADADGRS